MGKHSLYPTKQQKSQQRYTAFHHFLSPAPVPWASQYHATKAVAEPGKSIRKKAISGELRNQPVAFSRAYPGSRVACAVNNAVYSKVAGRGDSSRSKSQRQAREHKVFPAWLLREGEFRQISESDYAVVKRRRQEAAAWIKQEVGVSSTALEHRFRCQNIDRYFISSARLRLTSCV